MHFGEYTVASQLFDLQLIPLRTMSVCDKDAHIFLSCLQTRLMKMTTCRRIHLQATAIFLKELAGSPASELRRCFLTILEQGW